MAWLPTRDRPNAQSSVFVVCHTREVPTEFDDGGQFAPLSSYAWRIAAAVDSSTVNIA